MWGEEIVTDDSIYKIIEHGHSNKPTHIRNNNNIAHSNTKNTTNIKKNNNSSATTTTTLNINNNIITPITTIIPIEPINKEESKLIKHYVNNIDDEVFEKIWKTKIPDPVSVDSLPNPNIDLNKHTTPAQQKQALENFFLNLFEERYYLLMSAKTLAKHKYIKDKIKKDPMSIYKTVEQIVPLVQAKCGKIYKQFNYKEDIYTLLDLCIPYTLELKDAKENILETIKIILSDERITIQKEEFTALKAFMKLFLPGLISNRITKYLEFKSLYEADSEKRKQAQEKETLLLIAEYAAKIYTIIVENEMRLKNGNGLLKNHERSGFTFAVEKLPPGVRMPFQDRDSIADEEPPDDFHPDEIYKTRAQIYNLPLDMNRPMDVTEETLLSKKNKDKAAIEKNTAFIQNLMANANGTTSSTTTTTLDINNNNNSNNKTISEQIEQDEGEQFQERKRQSWKLLKELHQANRLRMYIFSGEKGYRYMLPWPFVESREFWPGDSVFQAGWYQESDQESKFRADILGNHDQWEKEKQLMRNHPLPPYQKNMLIINEGDTRYLVPQWRQWMSNMIQHWEQDSLFRTIQVNSFLEAILWYHVKMLSLLKRNILHIEHKMKGIESGHLNSTDIKLKHIYSKPLDNRNDKEDYSRILGCIGGISSKCFDYLWARFGPCLDMFTELNKLETIEKRIDLLIQIPGLSQKTAVNIIKKFCHLTLEQKEQLGMTNDKESQDELRLRIQILNGMTKKRTFNHEKFFPLELRDSTDPTIITSIEETKSVVKKKKRKKEEPALDLETNNNNATVTEEDIEMKMEPLITDLDLDLIKEKKKKKKKNKHRETSEPLEEDSSMILPS